MGCLDANLGFKRCMQNQKKKEIDGCVFVNVA